MDFTPDYSTYIGGSSKEPWLRGSGTVKQSFLVVLSTTHRKRYPEYVRVRSVSVAMSMRCLNRVNGIRIISVEARFSIVCQRACIQI